MHQNVVLQSLPNLAEYDGREPQIVQERAANSKKIYFVNRTIEDNQSLTNVRLTTRVSENDRAGIIAQGINRVSVISTGVFWCTPNINPRNNELRFFSTASSSVHTVFLTEGFYNNQTDVIDEIIDKLNSVTGASGLTFSASVKIPGSFIYDITSSGGLFYFENGFGATSSRGKQFFNFQTDSNPANVKTVGNISLIYTRYITFNSRRLTRYQKVTAVSNSQSGSDEVARLFIDNTRPGQNFFAYNFKNTFHSEPDDSFHEIDIRILDEYGDELYLPDIYNGGNFQFDIGLLVQ